MNRPSGVFGADGSMVKLFYRGLTVILLLTGCATVPPQKFPTNGVVAAPFDPTWSSIVLRVSEKGWPIKTIDKSSGLLVTDWMEEKGLPPHDAAVNDGYQTGIWARTRTQVNIVAQKKSETETAIALVLHVEVKIGNTSRPFEQWRSTGKMENDFNLAVASGAKAGYVPSL